MSSSARCWASFLDSRARRPIMRKFSSPVCASSSAANWPVRLIRRRTWERSRRTSKPATRARPASASVSVARMRTVVVLPAPFGPISGLPIMPREIAWFEDALACMTGTGLTEARKASVIMLLSGYVRNLAATEADIAAAVAASGLGLDEWMASYPAVLGQLTDPRRFPALTAFIAAGVFEAADEPDDEFVFGLERILDGVGVLVERMTP